MLEQMLNAIEDWVKNLIKGCKRDFREDMVKFEEELDIGTLLRKTGDASKTRVKSTNKTFSYGPTFTDGYENLDDILGTIIRAIKNMNQNVYFSGLIRTYKFIDEDAADGAFEETLEGGYITPDSSTVILIYGKGGAINANGRLTSDFYRAYMVFYKDPPSTAGYPRGRVLVQLGSSGSTARWSLAATVSSASANELLLLKIPKGSWAEIGRAYLNL